MSKNKYLSVIIPVFNGEAFIKDLIVTLNAVTYPHFEAVFINNNSRDKSINLLREELSSVSFNFQLLNETRQGQGYARNTGIAQSKGNYITFLDCDDRIHPGKYAKDLAIFKQHDVDFVFCRTQKHYEDGRIIKHPVNGFRKGVNTPPNLGLLWLENFFKLQGTGAIMITKKALNTLGGFHSMRTGQDAFLFIRMGLVFKGYFYDDIMFYYYRHPSSTVSMRNKKKDGTLHSYFNLRKELFLDEVVQSNSRAKKVLENQMTVDLLKLQQKGYKVKSIMGSQLQKQFKPPFIVWNSISLIINRLVPHIRYNPFYQFWNRIVKK